jgi:hypothetical protein
MPKGGGKLILAVLASLTLTFGAPAKGAAQPAEDPELKGLINSSSNPLPIVPIVVPQLRSRAEMDDILARGKRPTLFQISQPGGQYADPAKVRFFQMLAVEYALKINFRKIAAGSPAALRLFRPVSKPVYILCDDVKIHDDRCAFIDEAEMPAGREVKQTTIEDFIFKRLNIVPTLLTTPPITAANKQSIMFGNQPDTPDPTPIAILFFPGEAKATGPVNRLRVLIALERFFYANRLRTAECDLSASDEVYRSLLPNAAGGVIPTGPELWLINPVARRYVKYPSEGGTPPMAELTHAAFQAWLAQNDVAPPADNALVAEAAWRELARPGSQTNGN